jgi:hypothetical protein
MRRIKSASPFFLILLFAGTGLCQTEGAMCIEVNRLSDRMAVFKIAGGNANQPERTSFVNSERRRQ